MVEMEVHRRKKRFHRLFSAAIEEAPSQPFKLQVRDGQGMNVLLYSSQDICMQVRVSPKGSDRGGFLKSRLAEMGPVGEYALSEAEKDWLDRLHQVLMACDEEEGWSEYLTWALERPGISVVARDDGTKQTSGHEVIIRVIENCNAACEFCGCIGSTSDYATNMASVEERLLRGYGEGARRVAFTGGEPTLVKELPDFIRLAKEKGYDWVNLQTNGVRLADPTLTKSLAEAGLDSILLSLHSHVPEVHNQILKIEGAFDEALKGIAHCVENEIQVGLNYVINRDNVDVLPGYMQFVCDYFQSIGVNTTRKPVTVTLSFVSPVGWTLENLDQIPKLSDSAPKIAQALDMAEKWGVEAHIPGLCGVPLCILPGYEEFFDEFHEDTPPDIGIRGYVDACDSCSYRERCSGYWTKYMEIYGEDEFGQKEELPAWAIKEDVISLETIFDAIKESLPTLGIITDQFVQNIPIVELADALNEREVPMLKGGRWTEAKCQRFCQEHSLPDQIGPEQPLPQWAKQRSAEAPPAFVDQFKAILLELGVDLERGPQNIPYHLLSEALIQRGIPAPDGFEWNDAYCLEFCIVHGLYIPPKETVGWVVDGKVSIKGTHFWLRTLEGELVSFTDGIPTQSLFLGGEPDEMAALESFLSGRDNIESVQWVQSPVLGEESAVRVMRVMAREMRVIQWLFRRVKERFPSVLIYDSHWSPFERYLHGECKVDAGRPILVTHHSDGTIVGMENVEEEKTGDLPLTFATVAFEMEEERLVAAEILTPTAQRFEGEEKTLFEDFSKALSTVDPDVVFVRGGRDELAGLPARWRDVSPAFSPARLEGRSQRRARTMEQWFQGRVLVHENQWGSTQDFLEACSGEVLLPSRVSLQEKGRGALSDQVHGLIAGQLTRAM